MTDRGHADLRAGVTAVVCCHNSAAVIEPTMEALVAQSIPRGLEFEIILVDNRCSDDTVALARAVAAHGNAELQVLTESTLGLIHARRTGVSAATCGIIVFVDDDNVLEPDYVARVAAFFDEHPDAGAVGGFAVPWIRGNVPDWFPEFQTVFACGPQRETPGPLAEAKQYLYGAGLSFRTGVLRRIMLAGFAPILTGKTGDRLLRGDDTEMCYRCYLSGWTLYYSEDLRLRHNIDSRRISWRNACTMRRQSGVTWMLLNIYARIALGRVPPPLWYMRGLIIYRWLRFGLHPWSMLRAWQSGTAPALGLHFLLGMSWSVLWLGREYEQARRDIMAHYRPRAAP